MKFVAGALCLVLALALVDSMPQGYSVATFVSEKLGPDGIITGRSGFSDSSGKKHFTTYMVGPDGKRKVIKDDPEGDIEGRKLLTEVTQPDNFNFNVNDFFRPPGDFFRFPSFPRFPQFPQSLFPSELFPSSFFPGFGDDGNQSRGDGGYGPGQGGPQGPYDGTGEGQPIPEYPTSDGPKTAAGAPPTDSQQPSPAADVPSESNDIPKGDPTAAPQ